MTKRTIGLSGLLVAGMLASAEATSVTVTNYSWLQLLPGRVSISPQGGVGGGTGYGNPGYPRWGVWTWIPNGTMTSNGAADYAQVLQLDKPRQITHVFTQFWALEGTTLSGYHIQGSNDGTTWTDLGGQTFAPVSSIDFSYDLPTTTTGDYQFVRLLIKAGEYTAGTSPASRGGPGITTLQPYGNGVLGESEVNWANRYSFPTAVTSGGLDFAGNGNNTGNLMANNYGGRSGDTGNWEPGDFLRFDLGLVRRVDTMIIDWDGGWIATNFVLQSSVDGVTYQPVTVLGPTTNFFNQVRQYSLGTTDARFFRFSDLQGAASYTILNQVEFFHLIPEPASGILFLMGAGSVWFVRHRRRG